MGQPVVAFLLNKGGSMFNIQRCPFCYQLMLDGYVSTVNDEHVHFSLTMCPACYCELLADTLAPEQDKLRVVRELDIEEYWRQAKGGIA